MLKQKETIPAHNRQQLEKAIAKLNRKAAKLGCKPLVLTFSNEHNKEIHQHPYNGNKLSPPWVMAMVDAELEYDIPTLEGYELVARLDLYSGDNGPVVMVAAVPGQAVPEAYKNLDRIGCDHCGHKRARKHAILIHHIEDDRYMQVGTTCVKDFFGFNDPSGMMFSASIMFSQICGSLDDEYGMKQARDCWGYSLEEVFTMSAACIRHWGWLSATKARNIEGSPAPTAEHVRDNLNVWPNMPQELIVDGVSEEDKEEGRLTLAHWQAVDPGYNDYLQNCCNLIKLGYVPDRYLGVAVSMVATYQREALKLKERELMKAKHGESKHVGSIGDRLKGVEATCIYCRNFENEWGMKTLYTFRDASGNIFKTWYSGSTWRVEQGEEVVIDGTVKKHDEFKGEAQTMLNRVKATLKS